MLLWLAILVDARGRQDFRLPDSTVTVAGKTCGVCETYLPYARKKMIKSQKNITYSELDSSGSVTKLTTRVSLKGKLIVQQIVPPYYGKIQEFF